MPNRFRRTAALLAASSLALVPASAYAKSAPTSGGGDEDHAGSCSQPYKASAKKPFDKGSIADTEKCFENFVTQTENMAKTIKGFASGCAQSPDTRSEQGDLLIQLSKAGGEAVDITKKAKAKYFKAESAYYDGRRNGGAMQDKLDGAVTAIGKVSFDIDGFYSSVSGVGSAMANNDCDTALTHAASAAKAAAASRTHLADLKTALAKLK